MLRLRESVDGEALQWAAQRLRTQRASRRILMIVSDGLPMDTATQVHALLDALDDPARDLRFLDRYPLRTCLYGECDATFRGHGKYCDNHNWASGFQNTTRGRNDRRRRTHEDLP